MYQQFVGIDIASETAACFWETSQGQKQKLEIPQSSRAYQSLAKDLLKNVSASRSLVVMEATGNYWLRLALFLHQQGFPVAVLNPSHFYHFALSERRRAKTDLLDAELLARYGRLHQPTAWTPPPAIFYALQQRLSLREDLQNDRVRNLNRLHALRQVPKAETLVLARLERQIQQLEADIQALETEIRSLLNSEHEWSQSARRLLTIKGIGLITTAWLLTATQNFSRCQSPEEAAAYAGLAPYAHDSGKKHGKRLTGGGHPQLRKMLYMAAGAALRFNPPLRAFYQRLVQRGKIKQVARIAVARKLLHMAWACVVKERDFDPNFGRQSAIASFSA
jgi:transposase